VLELRTTLAAHLRSRQVSRLLYGAVVGLALVVGLEDHPPADGVMVGTILATAVAVGAAELYGEVVGTELRTRRLELPPGTRNAIVAEVVATLAGAAFPAVFFVLAAAGVLSTPTAFTVAKWTGLGLILAYGFGAARLAGRTRARSLGHAAAVGSIGGFLILVKSLLH
jgi:hypothetical protein